MFRKGISILSFLFLTDFDQSVEVRFYCKICNIQICCTKSMSTFVMMELTAFMRFACDNIVCVIKTHQ